MHLVRLTLFIFFLSTVQILVAQQPVFTNQQHFGVEDGLPQSFISCIIRDEDGFIWLATLNGFCSFFPSTSPAKGVALYRERNQLHEMCFTGDLAKKQE